LLKPDDHNFNKVCFEESKKYIPNTLSPNIDRMNDKFQAFKFLKLNARMKYGVQLLLKIKINNEE